MKTIRYILPVLFFSALFLLSCREEIPFEDEWGDPKLVVNTLLEAHQDPVVYLSRSRRVTDNSNENIFLTNGVLQLYEDDEFVAYFTHEGNGVYTLPHEVQEGKTYRIEAQALNFNSVNGSTKVPFPVELSEIDSIGTIASEWGDQSIQFKLKLNDPAGENFYRVIAWYWGEQEQWDEESQQWITGPAKIPVYLGTDLNNSDIFLNGGGVLFPDYLFEDASQVQIPVTADRYSFYGADEYSLVFELQNIDPAFYYYTRAVQLQQDAEDMAIFAEPVSMFNNVENGLGIVGSYSSSRDSIALKLEDVVMW